MGVLTALCLGLESKGLPSTEGRGRLGEKWIGLESLGRGWVVVSMALWVGRYQACSGLGGMPREAK